MENRLVDAIGLACALSIFVISFAVVPPTASLVVAQTPGPTIARPTISRVPAIQLPPLAQGTIGGWCVQEQGEDLFIHSEYSPRGPRLRLWRGSNGWMQVETRHGSATLWTSGLFEPEPMDYAEGKIRCPSAALQIGKQGFGSWQFDVAPNEVRIDHTSNAFTIILELRSARVRIEGLPSGARIVEPETHLTGAP